MSRVTATMLILSACSMLAGPRRVSHSVTTPSGPCGTARDRFSRCGFSPVTTDGLRLELQLQEGWSAGVHEWRVE